MGTSWPLGVRDIDGCRIQFVYESKGMDVMWEVESELRLKLVEPATNKFW